MKWDQEAEKAMRRVPFFVRKKVKGKVEEDARRSGADEVTMRHVTAAQNRFLSKMKDEVRGYRVETCFGANGCPNRAMDEDGLSDRLEAVLEEADLRQFLVEKVGEDLKMHHEFRVTLALCPNACSRPQIVDLGLIGARRPATGGGECTHCGACVEACDEQALRLDEEGPVIDRERCLGCGRCIDACPTGALASGETGFRVLAGGKLGRHPQLARELPGLCPAEKVPALVAQCIAHYKKHNRQGERWGEILNRTGWDGIEKDN